MGRDRHRRAASIRTRRIWERITAYPQSGQRLLREVRDLGYDGGYTAITDFLRTVRPPATLPFEVRFETPPGRQAQGYFDQFQMVFTDEPAVTRSPGLRPSPARQGSLAGVE